MRQDALKDKIKELQLRRLRQSDAVVRKGNAEVPAKKKSKPLPYKMQNTFENNLKGVPGGFWFKQAQAERTGTRTRKDEIGLLRSARNANTTQGSYIRTTVVDESGRNMADAQGRKVFGR